MLRIPTPPSDIAPKKTCTSARGAGSPSNIINPTATTTTPSQVLNDLAAIEVFAILRVTTLDMANAKPAEIANQSTCPCGHGIPILGLHNIITAPVKDRARLAKDKSEIRSLRNSQAINIAHSGER